MTITPTPPPTQPTTAIQLSSHNVYEYATMLFDEAEAYDVDVTDLRGEFERDGLSDDYGVIYDTLERIRDAGYLVVEQDDTLLIGVRNDDDTEPQWYTNWMEV